MNGMTKETFERADVDTKLDILFDYIKDMHRSQADYKKDWEEVCRDKTKNCDARFHKIEHRKLRDTTTASFFGLIGGFIAVLAKKIFMP